MSFVPKKLGDKNKGVKEITSCILFFNENTKISSIENDSQVLYLPFLYKKKSQLTYLPFWKVNPTIWINFVNEGHQHKKPSCRHFSFNLAKSHLSSIMKLLKYLFWWNLKLVWQGKLRLWIIIKVSCKNMPKLNVCFK